MVMGSSERHALRSDVVSWLRWAGRRFQKLVRNCSSVFAVVASLAIVVMALIGGADVFGTKILNMPIPGTFEVTETLMVVLVFGGLAYAQERKRHVRIEFLLRILSSRARAVFELFAVLVGDVFFILLTWRCYLLFWESWVEKELGPSVIGFPIYPSKLFMLLGSGLITLQLLIDTFVGATAVWREFARRTKTNGV